MTDERYSRQTCLTELGAQGQETLALASVTLQSAAFSAQVEREYLVRAGIGEVQPATSGSTVFTHAKAFRFDCCRDTAAGAWHALRTIRGILGLE